MIGLYRNVKLKFFGMHLITLSTFKPSMPFERFLVGNIRNRMLQAYATLVRGLTCLKQTYIALGFMKIIVCEIPPDAGAISYLSHGLKVGEQ